jgi:sugar lactone lactonase YvrE
VDGFGGGTEDVAVDPVTGGIYVSADPRRGEGPRGGIWLVRLGPDGAAEKQEVTGGQPAVLRPHGIDIWEDQDRAERRMFVINHDPAGSRIETYRIGPGGRLQWLGGKAYPELPRPNDLAAVGRSAFYAVNDHGSPRARNPRNPFAAENLETLLPLRKASAVHVQDGKAQVAATGLAFPAGIDVSPDLQTLYIGETSVGRISVFARRADNTLERRARHAAGPMPDNLTLAEDGLWYGAHSRLFRFLGHANNPAATTSPGRVEVMDPATGARRVVFRASGDELSTLSVGAPMAGRVVVGSIDQHRIGVCRTAER